MIGLGGTTIFLGTDDEQSQTSIGGIDLYPNVWEHVRNITNLRDHPYEFYQKHGFVIVDVIPDANGFGKPDILMAKRVLSALIVLSSMRESEVVKMQLEPHLSFDGQCEAAFKFL